MSPAIRKIVRAVVFGLAVVIARLVVLNLIARRAAGAGNGRSSKGRSVR